MSTPLSRQMDQMAECDEWRETARSEMAGRRAAEAEVARCVEEGR